MKRKQIKEIIESLHNTESLQNKFIKTRDYQKERDKILKIPHSNVEEYPPWDKSGFEKFLKSRSFDRSEEDEENETHIYRLKYYYSPDI